MLTHLCPRPCICIFVGVVLIASGTFITSSWAGTFKFIVSQILALRPDSMNFKMWESPPVPIYMDFYFFNWTNPHELLEKDKKPHLVEIGPYRFIQTKEKKDVVWNPNDTISFLQERVWFFDEETSVGPASDKVTTLNAVAVSSAYVARNWNFFFQLPLNQMLRKSPLSVTKSVSELLFDGYSDPLIDMAKIGNLVTSKLEVPFDKFGWFYTRNGSDEFEGVYNMGTGARDIADLADLKQWNYHNHTNYFPGHCGAVTGSMGERFPPERTRTEPLKLYSKEICRSVEFDYSTDEVVEGLTGYRYTGGRRVMDNGTLDPNNECYCGGHCLPSGVMNVSACQYGSPGFVSYPHFHLADPYYLSLVDGLNPDPAKHTFYATIEPTTGLPLDVAGRLQINILLQTYNQFSSFNNAPKIFFPMMWFEERATISPKLAMYVKLLLFTQPFGLAMGYFIIVVGVLLMTIAITRVYFYRKRMHSDSSKLTHTDNHTFVPLLVQTQTASITALRRGINKTEEHCNNLNLTTPSTNSNKYRFKL